MKLPYPPLLVITDRKHARAPLKDILAAAFEAGCRWASVREKDLPAGEQVALARELHAVARKWNSRLTLHGDPALAKEADVDGVHLSAGSDAASARQLLGAHVLIGLSVHHVEEARALDPAVIDYLVAGPAYATASKPGYGPFLGMTGIAAICEATAIPVIAIGGITEHGVDDMDTAGAAGVAVMGGVMRADDPGKEVASLIATLADESL
ncbi:MAG: thiamine-phosphate pyrophosphorylase, partial [Variibacter sp.]|nr:thiamine-phosphate pyrophosphorylase [Variibacter sp.]